MIEGNIVETYKKDGEYYVVSDNSVKPSHVSISRNFVNYYSPSLDKLGFYEGFRENLIISKRIFLQSHLRLNKLVYGNKAFLRNQTGVYANIIYYDFKAFYPTIYKQIANHINENYMGKEMKNIVKRKIYIREIDAENKFSKKAKEKAPLIDIHDIASNGVKIDANDKSEFIELINRIEGSEFVDNADRGVAKITRNAMVFGFGYQQKIARVSNISALVMFFASRVMEYAVRRFEELGNKVIFSHTDSFMSDHFNTRDLDDAIKYACEMLNAEYFNGIPILHLDIGNTSIKNKFDELMIINQNSYIYSRQGDKGKLDVELAIGGLTTPARSWGGISRNNESIKDIISDNAEAIFRGDREFFKRYEDTEFIYSPLQDRLSYDYKQSIINAFAGNKPQNRYINISNTLKHIGNLVQPIVAKA